MTTESADIGDKKRLTCTFLDAASVAADPATVTFSCREPDATETTYTYGVDEELVKTSTGVYYVEWSCTQAGRHVTRFVGTGTLDQAVQTELYVRRNDGV